MTPSRRDISNAIGLREVSQRYFLQGKPIAENFGVVHRGEQHRQ
jgi:hypothetical protein